MLFSLLFSIVLPKNEVYAVDKTKNVVRYCVLILDASGSMFGTPASKQKEAAIKFCDSVLNADGANYVAIVKMNSSASTAVSFTNDIEELKRTVRSINSSGGTNINSALTLSNRLLSEIDDNSDIVKNVILCTDGMPESGSSNILGPYTYSDYSGYAYANTVYETAQIIKKSYNLYTLGFFHSLNGNTLTFARRFLDDLQNKGYYEVTDSSELQFTFGDIAENITNNGVQTFYYDNGYSAECYYKDDYFTKDSYTYNPSLATMSLSFAMSAFANQKESDYAFKSSNAKDMMQRIIGISEEEIEVNDAYLAKPSADSIGVIAGNKKITVNDEEYTLIAIAIRGGGYEQEWASNFTIGKTGQHVGFQTAKNNVISFLKSYISNKQINGKVKFWITGYSRAAATANLVGGAIDDFIEISQNISYERNDVYTYCFETPAGALTENVKNMLIYYNIFNIINSSDPVPYVAPFALGFSRYGKDLYLPSKETTKLYNDLRDGMLEIYNSLDSTGEYVVDNFQMKKIAGFNNWLPGGKKISLDIQNDIKNNYSQGVFLSTYITILAKDFILNRDNYVDVYQDEIREVCKVYFGNEEAQTKKLQESFISQAKSNWKELVKEYILSCINPWGNEDDALIIVSEWFKTAIDEAEIKGYDRETIERAGMDLADLMLALISNHPNYFTTAVYNIESLGAAHYPELCFSWLASMDDNYSSHTTTSFSSGSYRIIRINCEVDVSVFDENGNTVAAIINEEPQNLGDYSLISGINENDEKYVVLPVDATYAVEITGRSDDAVNYEISEYSAEMGDFTRIVNYFDVSLKKGATLKGTIPAYSQIDQNSGGVNGSNVDYILYDSRKQLLIGEDLKGDEATNAYYSVIVSIPDETSGRVLGQGTYQYGNFAKLSASENDGYTFDGWYSGEDLVSSEKEYRICVKSNTELVAKFKKTSRQTDKTQGNDEESYVESSYASAVDKETSGTETDTIEDKIESKKTLSSAKISLKKTTFTYNGKKITPVFTVKNDSTILIEGTDYRVTYKRNASVGTATVVITGIGNYSGSITEKFKIVPKGSSILKLISKKKGFTIKWKKQTKLTSGYQLQYSTSKKFSSKMTIVKTISSNKETTLKLTGLKGHKKYYIRIRTYKIVDGKYYYSSWSKMKTITTKK